MTPPLILDPAQLHTVRVWDGAPACRGLLAADHQHGPGCRNVAVECAGVTDYCQGWAECRPCNADPDDDLVNGSIVHRQVHRHVPDLGWAVPTTNCWLEQIQAGEDLINYLELPGPGCYAVGLDDPAHDYPALRRTTWHVLHTVVAEPWPDGYQPASGEPWRYSLRCPGVTDACRTWVRCGTCEQHTVGPGVVAWDPYTLVMSDGVAHGVAGHRQVVSTRYVPGDQCAAQHHGDTDVTYEALAITAPGEYPVIVNPECWQDLLTLAMPAGVNP
jgi:hypothetical protein